jgi:hypothetical protein
VVNEQESGICSVAIESSAASAAKNQHDGSFLHSDGRSDPDKELDDGFSKKKKELDDEHQGTVLWWLPIYMHALELGNVCSTSSNACKRHTSRPRRR